MSREFRRRARLVPDEYCTNSLLSYPRSGNHLLRFLIESSTGRPTLGAIDRESFALPVGLHDLPVYLAIRGMRVKDVRPIIVKRHWVNDDEAFDKTIFLVREPVEAILSHLRDCTEDEFREQAPIELALFRNNENHFEKLPEESKLGVHYEDLVTDGASTMRSVLSFLIPSAQISEKATNSALARVPNAYAALQRAASEDPRRYREIFPGRATFLESL